LPWALKRRIYSRVLGWDLHPGSRVGVCILRAGHVRLGAGAHIGSANVIDLPGRLELDEGAWIGTLNVIRGCEAVRLGAGASIAYQNWVSGPSRATGLYPHSPDRRPECTLGAHASVVRQHRVECSDAVTIGAYTVLAGVRTQVLTHGIDVMANVQRTAPVEIGAYGLVGSGSIIQSGSQVPDKTVVAPGAVVHGRPGDPEQLIGGVPARPLSRLDGAAYFRRTSGWVE
jgi:acetyltransferase-like isoleucine patch superfamily enzyme